MEVWVTGLFSLCKTITSSGICAFHKTIKPGGSLWDFKLPQNAGSCHLAVFHSLPVWKWGGGRGSGSHNDSSGWVLISVWGALYNFGSSLTKLSTLHYATYPQTEDENAISSMVNKCCGRQREPSVQVPRCKSPVCMTRRVRVYSWLVCDLNRTPNWCDNPTRNMAELAISDDCKFGKPPG